MKQLFDNGTESSAIFSPCEKYRYTLVRQWNPDLRSIAFLCLNPSTATAIKNDNTVSRCIEFSRQWGFGRYTMLNLFGWRSTDPKGLLATNDPIGTDNDRYISETIAPADAVCCAWGTHSGKVKPLIAARVSSVLDLIPEAKRFCLAVNKDGNPKHPLYCASSLTLIPFNQKLS